MPNDTRTGVKSSGKRSGEVINKNLTVVVKIVINILRLGQKISTNNECLQPCLKHDGGSGMIWGCISAHGVA